MFKCQNCNKEFKTKQALGSHEGKCKFNKKYHFIYKTSNLVNNKYYIGMHSTNDIDDGYLGSGTRLHYSIRKYGKENFHREILEYLPDRNSLALRESEIVTSKMILDELCMNLKPGGKGGFCNDEHRNNFIKISHEKFLNKLKTDKTFKTDFYNKISNTLKLLWQDENFKQIHMPNNMFFNGNAFLGKTHKEETKRKIGAKTKLTQKAELNSQYGTCWIIKEDVAKKIKKDELDTYIEDGWIKGRKCNNSKKLKEFYKLHTKKSTLKNKVSINKDGIIKFIDKNLLQEYIIEGWKIGRKFY